VGGLLKRPPPGAPLSSSAVEQRALRRAARAGSAPRRVDYMAT